MAGRFTVMDCCNKFFPLRLSKIASIIVFLAALVFFTIPAYAADTTPPTGTVTINNNAQYTNSTSVILNLFAQDNKGGSGLYQMKFSTDNLTWSMPEAYATTRAWTLASGNGTKTVYVKFSDKASNWSAAYSDSIILDTTPPTGLIKINNDAAYVNKTAVTLNLSAVDAVSGMSQMRFSNNNVTWSNVIIDCHNTLGQIGLTVYGTGFTGSGIRVVRCPGGAFLFC